MTIDIPCNELKVIEGIVNKFSKTYNINFNVLGKENRDGVIFFTISFDDLSPSAIFEMGYYYCMHIGQLRKNGEIDW